MAVSDNGGGGSVRERVMAIQLGAERRIQVSKERTAQSAAVFRRHLKSTRALAQQNHGSLEKLDQLKEEFTELQAEFFRAQSVKTRNDSKMNIMKEEFEKQSEQYEKINKLLSERRTKTEEFTSIVANNSSNLKNLESKVFQDEENLNTAIGWYQNILGFRVFGGNGLTFIFNKLNSSNPKEEFSFIVKLEKNKYIVSECNPPLEGTDYLLKELNKTKDLFRFVRVMREKFASSVSTETISVQQASSSLVESSPVISTSGKGKKGLKTPSSSVRRSGRLRGTGGS